MVFNAPIKYVLENIYKTSDTERAYHQYINSMRLSLSPIRVFCITDFNDDFFDEMGYESFIYTTPTLEEYFDSVYKYEIKGLSLLFPFKIDHSNKKDGIKPVILTALYPYINESDFQIRKDKILEEMFNVIEQEIPKLSSSLKLIRIIAPSDLERRTYASCGAMYGWECTPDQFFKNRPNVMTPISGMFLSGHWSRPAHGVSGAIQSGYIAYKSVKRFLKNLMVRSIE